MKKLALGVATILAGTAYAQSSITIYGALDLGYAKSSRVRSGMTSSFQTPSVVGFRGSEDLGGGLKANFNLETGKIDATSGGSTLTFARKSWVGMSGGFGVFKIGLDSSMAIQGQSMFDLNGLSATNAKGLVSINPSLWYASPLRSAQFQYETPSFNGFDAAISYVPAGNTTANKGRTAIRVNYKNGGLAVGLVGESAATSSNRTATALSAGYDWGSLKVVGGYVRSENVHAQFSAPTANYGTTGATFGQSTATSTTTGGGQGYYVGVSAPFGAATVGAQYANNTDAGAKALELFTNYNLSKRTYLYADVARATYNSVSFPDLNRFGIGLVHRF